MDNIIRQSTDFVVNEMSILTKVGKKIDIREMFEELNLYDSLLTPVRSGNVLIRDAQGLSEILELDGSEYFIVNIEKGAGILSFSGAYRIYKQSMKQKTNETSETYMLHFVADELIFSNQQKINQSYETTYAEAAVRILIDYLRVPITDMKGTFDSSIGTRKFVIPNLSPIEAIEWCARRSIDKNGSSSFLFFQNQYGFNFCSLSTLIREKPLFTINFNPKNTEENIGNELFGARAYKVLKQFDFLKKVQSGSFSGSFIGFDPLTRTVSTGSFSFLDHYKKMNHLNSESNLPAELNRSGKYNFEMTKSRVTLFPFEESQKLSNYIKTNDGSSVSKIDDTHNYIFQRKAIFENFTDKRIRILMPGNFALTSGFNVDLKIPSRSIKNDQREMVDESLSGVYNIISTRHIIKPLIHETVIDVCTDSTNKKVSVRDERVDVGRLVA